MRTNDLFLTAAAASLMMLAACTHDDGTTSISEPTPVGNELIISTRHSEMGITRAESNIQGTQFKSGESIHIYLRDAANADTTRYYSPLIYTSDGSGGLTTITNGNKIYWPRLMHSLHIYGVYPTGSMDYSKMNTDLTSITLDTYRTEDRAFDKFFPYFFTVERDQTSEDNYKASDLMTGLPTTYTHTTDGTQGPSFSAPFTLRQNVTPGNIPLTFTHRLTKVIVNVKITEGTNDIEMNDIWDTNPSPEDNKYARVALVNTKRKTWFSLYNNNNTGENTTDDFYDVVTTDRILSEAPDSVIVGQGKTPIDNSSNANSLTLSAIVPPQTLTEGLPFIKVFLIYDSGGSEVVTNTFIYKIPDDGDATPNEVALTLEASKVYTFNISINKPNITVTTSISPWTVTGANDVIGVLQ